MWDGGGLCAFADGQGLFLYDPATAEYGREDLLDYVDGGGLCAFHRRSLAFLRMAPPRSDAGPFAVAITDFNDTKPDSALPFTMIVTL